MNAIPTLYNGTQFRSRLEAKWAAFFDMCGWHWEYEPFDLDGWIPDFELIGKENLLVEVKPYTRLDEFDTAKYERACAGTTRAETEILLLGSKLETIFDDRPNYPVIIGWLGEFMPDGTRNFAMANLVCVHRYPPSNVDICHDEQSFRYRLTGFYDGGPYHFPAGIALEWWREAGNRVQWRAPR